MKAKIGIKFAIYDFFIF